MATRRTPTRHDNVWKTGAGTFEAHVHNPQRRPDGRRGKPFVDTFPTLGEALAWQTMTKEAVRTHTHRDRATSPLVREQMRVWQARQTQHRPTTARSVEDTITRLIEPSDLGAIPLIDLSRDDIQAWVDDLAARLAPVTVRTHAAWLRAMLIDAAEADPPHQPLIPASPMRRVKLPKSAVRVMRADRILLPAQVNRLAAEMTCPWQGTMVRVAAATGVRRGELLGWRVGDINFFRKELHLDTQLNVVTRERAELKAGPSRVVPLPQRTIYDLARHIENYPPLSEQDGLIFYDRDRRGTTGPEPCWYYGLELTRASKRLHAADPSFPVVSSHDLRHHYVSLLIYQGHSAVAIGKRIGDTPARVWDTYAHVWPGTEDDTRKAIDEAYERLDDEPDAESEGGR